MVNPDLLDLKVKEVNLTYTMLAELAGCNRTTFYNIKKGITNPSYEIINSIVYILALSPSDTQAIFFSKRIVLPAHTVELLNRGERITGAV